MQYKCTISGDTTNYALAHANPIRYHGYYYDSETGLYYCNARYYSPKWRQLPPTLFAVARPISTKTAPVRILTGANLSHF